MRVINIGSFLSVGLLCLPSLAGGPVHLYNCLLRRPIAEWGLGSSITVAFAMFCGTPLVVLATFVVALCSSIPAYLCAQNWETSRSSILHCLAC
jgi:hypothetical protein